MESILLTITTGLVIPSFVILVQSAKNSVDTENKLREIENKLNELIKNNGSDKSKNY